MSQVFCQGVLETIWVARVALPYNDNVPPGGGEGLLSSLVALDVSVKLPRPELHVGFGASRQVTSLVPMPIAAMDENRRAVTWQDDIRRTGQISPVKSEPMTHDVQGTSHTDLW